MTFVSLVLIQFFKAYNFRSDRHSVLREPFANKWLNLAILWELILLGLILYVPFLERTSARSASVERLADHHRRGVYRVAGARVDEVARTEMVCGVAVRWNQGAGWERCETFVVSRSASSYRRKKSAFCCTSPDISASLDSSRRILVL